MWASIPDNLAPKFNNAVLAINSQVPAGYAIYLIAPDAAEKKGNHDADTARAKEAFEAALAGKKGVKFRPEYIETWHARRIPGNSVVIGNNPWDKHPAYVGPEDTKVFVYIPKLVDEKEADARQMKGVAKEKAEAVKDQPAGDGTPTPDGALAAGGPADPTLALETTETPKKTAAKKAPAKKAATKKKSV